MIQNAVVAIKGHLDGKVFVPDEPVDLPRNRPLVIHVECRPSPWRPQRGKACGPR